MKISEILIIPDQEFPRDKVEKLLNSATKLDEKFPWGQYDVWASALGSEIMVMLVDQNSESPAVGLAAFAGFLHRDLKPFQVYQSKNADSYTPYKNQNLVAKLYKYVKEIQGMNIQSDVRQTLGGKKLWTDGLQKVGLQPRIFDTESEMIIDKNNEQYDRAISKMYTDDPDDIERFRYTWVLESRDEYPYQNILKENSLLMPYKGFWYTFPEHKNNEK